EVAAFDQKLRAVAPTAFRQGERDLRGGRNRLLRLGKDRGGRLALLDAFQHALEDELKAEASGVDDTRVAQDLELARRLEHGGARAGGGGGADSWNVGVGAPGSGRRGTSRLASDGEDGALGRLVDRGVGGIGRLLESAGQSGRTERALAFVGSREPRDAW